jgi:hypothetical protein
MRFRTTAIYGGIEYDVWDGVHDGQDRDLLNDVAMPAKQPAPVPLVRHRGDMTAIVWDALPSRDQGGVTIDALMTTTALAKSTVYHALDTLKRRGRVESQPIPTAGRFIRAPQWYWRSREAPIDNDAIVVGAVESWLRRE